MHVAAGSKRKWITSALSSKAKYAKSFAYRYTIQYTPIYIVRGVTPKHIEIGKCIVNVDLKGVKDFE